MKAKEARRAEALKKAKREKVIIGVVGAVAAVAVIALIIVSIANQSGGTRDVKGGDVDLTPLSVTMLYAEINNIYQNADRYLGHNIKMKGPYYTIYDEQSNKQYHYIIAEVADDCCIQGFEFIINGEPPADFPAIYEEIELSGTFQSYENAGQTLYYISVENPF
ncbi:MAG: hypothetical protein FWG90_04620 [Oscillospiraceae bacterium]|nr:hypothetical protein [Oscillospiraceae bacterium]